MAWPSCPCSSRARGLTAGSYCNPWGRKEVLQGSTADHLNGGKEESTVIKKKKKEKTHTQTPQSTYKQNKTANAAWTVPSISRRLTTHPKPGPARAGEHGTVTELLRTPQLSRKEPDKCFQAHISVTQGVWVLYEQCQQSPHLTFQSRR